MDLEEYRVFRNVLDEHLWWALKNNAVRTEDEWDTLKAEDLSKRFKAVGLNITYEFRDQVLGRQDQ